MRKAYPSFYRPSQDESETTWRKALFALDASFLLNLYRYSERTRADVLATLTKLKDQLWLPHQAGLEFHRNRPSAMHDQARKFTTMRTEFESARKRVESLYRDPARAGNEAATLEEAWERLDGYLAEQEKRAIQPTMAIDEDAVLSAITELLDGRVGQPYSSDRLDEIYTEGVERYSRKVPPGFEDEAKPEPERYGDLVVWLQMIEHAKSTKRPIIFVTADEKRDWWWVHEGRTLGPLPALVQELGDASGQPFWAYKPDQFISLFGSFVDREASARAIQELRDTRPPMDQPRIQPRAEDVRDEDIERLIRALDDRRRMLDRSARKARLRAIDPEASREDREAAEARLADLRRRWRGTDIEEAALRQYGAIARNHRRHLSGVDHPGALGNAAYVSGTTGQGTSSEIFERLVEAIQNADREAREDASDDDVDEDLG